MIQLYTTALIISSSLIYNILPDKDIPTEVYKSPITVNQKHYDASGVSGNIKTSQEVKLKNIETVDIESIQSLINEEEPPPKGRWVTAIVTAYSPHFRSCGRWSRYGKTSTGVQVRTSNPDKAYGIAADPKLIPYGTRIFVPGYWEMLQNNKVCVPTEMTEVDDTGGGMRQSARRGIIHIDVRFRTEKAAIEWGRRKMDIFIYD